MCRTIKTLFNFDPLATEEEIRGASLQFVRKISGLNKPSKVNEAAFQSAVEDISRVSGRLFVSLRVTNAPKNREVEATRAKERTTQRLAR